MFPSSPDIPFEFEAIDAVTKFFMLKEYGAAYTFDSLDGEMNRSMLLLSSCQKYYNSKMEFEHAKAQFISSPSI